MVWTKSLPLFVLLVTILLPETAFGGGFGGYGPFGGGAFGDKCECCPCPCKCDCKTVFPIIPTVPPVVKNETVCVDVCLSLGLIIDGSSSITPDSWDDMVTFFHALTDAFVIGPNHTEVGMVQFASQAQEEFPFNANQDNAALKDAFDSVIQKGGATSITSAIELFLNTTWLTRRLSPPSNCAELHEVVLIITDGLPNVRPEARFAQYAALQSALPGAVIAVGVGLAAEDELVLATGDPDAVHHIDTYAELVSLLGTLVEQICHGVETTVTAAPGTPGLPLTTCQCCCPPPAPVKFTVGPWTPTCGDDHSSSSTETSSMYMSTQ